MKIFNEWSISIRVRSLNAATGYSRPQNHIFWIYRVVSMYAIVVNMPIVAAEFRINQDVVCTESADAFVC